MLPAAFRNPILEYRTFRESLATNLLLSLVATCSCFTAILWLSACNRCSCSWLDWNSL